LTINALVSTIYHHQHRVWQEVGAGEGLPLAVNSATPPQLELCNHISIQCARISNHLRGEVKPPAYKGDSVTSPYLLRQQNLPEAGIFLQSYNRIVSQNGRGSQGPPSSSVGHQCFIRCALIQNCCCRVGPESWRLSISRVQRAIAIWDAYRRHPQKTSVSA